MLRHASPLYLRGEDHSYWGGLPYHMWVCLYMCGYFYYSPFSFTLVFNHMVMWQAYIIPGKQRWGPNAQQLFYKVWGVWEGARKTTWEKGERWLYVHVQQKSSERNTEKKRVLGDNKKTYRISENVLQTRPWRIAKNKNMSANKISYVTLDIYGALTSVFIMMK
jgi:hypothetical protein